MRDAVGLFMALATQWRWAGAGLAGAFRLGLDYNAVEPTARMLRVELTPTVFNDLRVMETEALSVWSKRRG